MVVRGIGIVALAPNNWRGQWVNRQHLLTRLGRHWPVVYSSGAWTVWDRGSDAWRRAPCISRFIDQDNVCLDEPSRWLLRWPRVARWDNTIVGMHARGLRRKVHTLGARQAIAYVFHPMFAPYVEHLGAVRLVYHAYDLFDHQPSWSSELEKAERELLRRADLVIVPSDALAEELSKKVDRGIHVLLNAANVDSYVQASHNPTADPPDLASIPHPRIGYVGSLHPQLDYPLVLEIARARPNYHWVMIGPIQRSQDVFRNAAFQAISSLPNVHLLGEKRHDEVAAYTVKMDVNVMIYETSNSSWTRVAYPLKLHEYLGSGRPVVSVDLPMVRTLSHVVRFASGPTDWINALDAAIASGGTGTTAERQDAAAGHSWEGRAQVLQGWLEDLVHKAPVTGE